MAAGDRLRRLDDNRVSDGVVWLSDHFGWWWNLGLGLLFLLAAPVVLYTSEDRAGALALLAFGAAGVLIGLVLRAGRNRRRRAGS